MLQLTNTSARASRAASRAGSRLKVQIEAHSGFCFGVVFAVELAEEWLEKHGTLYCLGDLVHNEEEIARLEKLGMRFIGHEEYRHLGGATVLIRAHGEAPWVYEHAQAHGIELVDATCPVIIKMRDRILRAEAKGERIAMLGNAEHPEMVGVLGHLKEPALVASQEEDLPEAGLPASATLFSQTTKSSRALHELADSLEAKGVDVKVQDTICRQVSGREPAIREFAREQDVIVFVAGRKSSNGKTLFGVAKEENARTYFVSTSSELEAAWFKGAHRVGICGATSTPMWLMEEVKAELEKL